MFGAFDRQLSLPSIGKRQAGRQRGALLAVALGGLFVMGCMEPEPQYLPPLPDMAGGNQAQGVPCAVAKLLADRCLVCHGQPPAAAPISLVSYESLTAVSSREPSKKVIERALVRMQDNTDPMPPGPAATVPQSELTAVQTWLTAGTPLTQCATK